MDKPVLCPQCRGALNICEDGHESMVECPRCGCRFNSSEAKEVSPSKLAEAAEHAVDAKT